MTAETTPQPIISFCHEVLDWHPFPRQEAALEEIYRDEITTAILRWGRRAGKSKTSAAVAVYEATAGASRHLQYVAEGEPVAIVVIARNPQQRAVIHGFIRRFLERPALSGLVLKDNEDEITLRSGVSIVTVPCHAASVRGFATPIVLADELAWWTGRDGSPLDPKEIMDGISPGMAQFPHRKLLILSTPRWAASYFADQIALASSGRFPHMRAFYGTTAELNPKIPADWLEEEKAKDPASFAREYEASFTSGISATFDDALVRASVRQGLDRLPPIPGQAYLIATDPAMVSDTWSAVVAHAETSGRIVVDYVTGWTGTKGAPLQVDETLDQLALLSAAYNRAELTTDQYSAESVRQGLVRRGLTVSAVAWTNQLKVDAVTAVRKAMYAGKLELPNHPKLLAELTSLETRPSPSGLPRTSAPPGQHDDHVSALLAVVNALTVDDRPGILGVYDVILKRGTEAEKPPGPVREWTVPKAPELARAQCPVSLRVDNVPVRCSLWHGHPGECVPVPPVPA